MRRYTLSNFLDALQDPEKFAREADRLCGKVVNPIFERLFGSGINIMNEDWDNLILLDACRYDYFEAQVNITGNLDQVVSKGAHSWEFMQGNFVGKEYHDTVYVTANPHAEKLDDDIFYTVETVLDSWDTELGTVLPGDVVSAAISAHTKYPKKRLLVHFMQPHKPHLGPTADSIRERIDLRGWDKYHGRSNLSTERSGINQWEAVRNGHISIEELRQAYSETLDIALKHAARLIDELPGKSVISSDHGEMLGDRGIIARRYGHPHDIYNRQLRVVPWFTVESDLRRKITSEDPIESESLDDDIVNQRLRALGYTSER